MTGGFPIRLIAMSSRRRMPPEYVDTGRVAASVSAKRSSRSSAIVAGFVKVPEPGDEDEVLPSGEDLVDGCELPGEADRLPHVCGLGRDVEAVDARRAGVGLQQG